MFQGNKDRALHSAHEMREENTALRSGPWDQKEKLGFLGGHFPRS